MRFFTMDWWNAYGDTGDDAPVNAYYQHFDSIRSSLPREVEEFYESHTLHDSRLIRLDADTGAGNLAFLLHGWDIELQHRRAYWLEYSGTSSFRLISGELEAGWDGNGLNDLGYDEFDLAMENTFEHRMLFASGVEMAISFKKFSFKVEPLPDDHDV